ncbi:MAG: DUF2911 domain-containing protein [Saprospiraceae bacterium]|nr:DUF2911 domain-containing protein [Saprospiraceae bacterium]
MKKFLKWAGIIIGSLAVILFIAFKVLQAQTKKHSPEDTVTYTQGDIDLSVYYNRPSVKGREIFGGLVPYGKVWRTGANEATTFTTNKDLNIGGSQLPAGKYTLWTIPGEQSWKVIFNEKQYSWGVNFDGEATRDPAEDVLQVDASVQKLSESVELFTIELSEQGAPALVIKWANTKVSLPIQ